jgi:hypothetical protein
MDTDSNPIDTDTRLSILNLGDILLVFQRIVADRVSPIT